MTGYRPHKTMPHRHPPSAFNSTSVVKARIGKLRPNSISLLALGVCVFLVWKKLNRTQFLCDSRGLRFLVWKMLIDTFSAGRRRSHARRKTSLATLVICTLSPNAKPLPSNVIIFPRVCKFIASHVVGSCWLNPREK